MDITELDLLAYICYAQDSAKERQVPVRWLCLREDLRAKYLKDAKEFLDDFRRAEFDAEKRRDASASKFAGLTVEVPSDSDK